MSQLPPEPNPPAMDAAAIGQLIREELDRSNKYLEFSQNQIERDRTFFKHLYALTASFITIIIGVGLFFSYSSISQMRSDMKASVDTAVNQMRAEIKTSVDAELERDKQEIAGLTNKGKEAIADAQNKTTAEMVNIQSEVRQLKMKADVIDKVIKDITDASLDVKRVVKHTR